MTKTALSLNSVSLAPKVVGLLGQAGAGKDTVASFILETVQGEGIALADPMKDFAQAVFLFSNDQLRGPSAFRNAPDERYGVHTAGPVSDARTEARRRFYQHAAPWLCDILPPDYLEFEQAYKNLCDWFRSAIGNETITPRYILQTLGTEFGRSVSEDIWIDYGLQRAREALAKNKWAVLKDIRFLNEAKKLRQLGCEVWRITRPNLDNNIVDKAGVSGHASENEQKSPEMDGLVSQELLNSGSLDDLFTRVKSLITR